MNTAEPIQEPCYFAELFLDEADTTYWCLAECECGRACGCSRSASEAAVFVASFCGPFDDYMHVGIIRGRIEETGDGPWFYKDPEGRFAVWEVEAQ